MGGGKQTCAAPLYKPLKCCNDSADKSAAREREEAVTSGAPFDEQRTPRAQWRTKTGFASVNEQGSSRPQKQIPVTLARVVCRSTISAYLARHPFARRARINAFVKRDSEKTEASRRRRCTTARGVSPNPETIERASCINGI